MWETFDAELGSKKASKVFLVFSRRQTTFGPFSEQVRATVSRHRGVLFSAESQPEPSDPIKCYLMNNCTFDSVEYQKHPFLELLYSVGRCPIMES